MSQRLYTFLDKRKNTKLFKFLFVSLELFAIGITINK